MPLCSPIHEEVTVERDPHLGAKRDTAIIDRPGGPGARFGYLCPGRWRRDVSNKAGNVGRNSSQDGHAHTAETDFDLHGIVGIRLCGASKGDIKAVRGQLGPIQARLDREPDIVIRFVDRLQTCGPIRYLGVDDAGFTDDAFLVLRSKHKTRAMVQIPFASIGESCEIVCERGLPAVPLLIPILNLTALAKGSLPLHAAAFNYDGAGVLVTGWAKGGKTETLLAFMANGAEYIGDEWIYLDTDGQQMYGIPEPIRVWDWHLQEMPQYRSLVGRGDRARLWALGSLVRGMEWGLSRRLGRGTSPVRQLSRIHDLVKRQLHVQLSPRHLFPDDTRSLSGTTDKVFFVASHELDEITIQKLDAEEVARRMVFSLQEERMDFMSYYMKFRFAFPDARNVLIEQVEEVQRSMLLRALAGKETHAVYHPYPVSIPALFDVMKRVL